MARVSGSPRFESTPTARLDPRGELEKSFIFSPVEKLFFEFRPSATIVSYNIFTVFLKQGYAWVMLPRRITQRGSRGIGDKRAGAPFEQVLCSPMVLHHATYHGTVSTVVVF